MQIEQHHTGTGDNVGRDKIVNMIISDKAESPSLYTPVKAIIALLILQLVLGLWTELVPSNTTELLINLSDKYLGLSYTVLWVSVFIMLSVLALITQWVLSREAHGVYFPINPKSASVSTPRKLGNHKNLVDDFFYKSKSEVFTTIRKDLNRDFTPVKWTAICGVGGSGKTTMARFYFNEAYRKQIYGYYVWLDASEGIEKGPLRQAIFKRFKFR